jgi:diguanylate cyclase (GGDEF)-like protein
MYAAVLTLTMTSWTGVAGHWLWSRAGLWNDIAPGILGLLAGGSALLFINHLCGVNQRHKWFDSLLYGVAAAGVPVAVVYAQVDRTMGVPMVSVYLAVLAFLGFAKAFSTWRRHDVIGLWVLVAFGPIGAATGLRVASVMGFTPSSWISRYGLMVGLVIEVPLLLIALNLRSRERHSVETRAQAIVSQDALTGLLTAHLFHDRLAQVVSRARRYKEPAAVVYIELANYRYIKKTWGVAVAEQSLLRSVIKLRRILRDVDTVGRVDEARFGLVLEGATNRTPVIEMAARLIAAGLMPLKGLKPEVVLQFHVAGVLLAERMGSADELSQSLGELIDKMGPRTRRQIRFLEPELTTPMPLEGQSEFESMNSAVSQTDSVI